jgi:alpha/beta superfamily hydrolase
VDAAWRRRITLASAPGGSRQAMIPAADHFYAGREDELARTLDAWLGEVLR